MSSKTKAVLYWPDSEQVSTEDLSIVNEEDRYQNAVTSVKMRNKFYKAVVCLISSDTLKLEEEMDTVAKEIDIRLEQKQKDESKAKRKRTNPKNVGAASENEVASSLGEKLRPTADQAPRAKQLLKEKKAAAAAQRSAQDEVDHLALESVEPKDNARRELFKNFDTVPDNDSEDEAPPSDDDRSVMEYDSDEEDVAELVMDTSKCCAHCLHLRKACNQSPALFIKAVGKFMGASCASGTQYLEVLEVPSSAQRVELSKGSKVYLSNADKTYIKKEGGGDPSKMTRLGLLSLFGRDNMEREQVTAKGQKSGSKGIRKNVRDALRAFVNRNKGNAYKELDETRFNQVINRKKNSIHRVRKSPASVKAKNASSFKPRTVTGTTLNSPATGSPRRKTPTQVSPAKASPGTSSAKSSVFQSPFQTSPLKMRQSPFSSQFSRKVIQSPAKNSWNVMQLDSRTEGNTNSSQFSWAPALSGQSYSYNNQQGYNHNSSYPTGQGTYSSQPETWYQNFGAYVNQH